MSRDINPFGLRMPQHIRSAAEQSAEKNGRSLNSEIVFQLQQAYPAAKPAPAKPRSRK